MRLKRLLLTAAFVLAAMVVIVPGASAGDFVDEQCPDQGGENYVCPAGQVGVAYSHKFLLKEPEPGCPSFAVTSGSLPPGLTLSSEGVASGIPTEAGNFAFYITVTYSPCVKPASDRRFVIPINPAIPKLIIGPEQAGVPFSTVGAPFSLPMTANLSDAKTWSLVAGALPPGLALDATTGVIAGTPTTAGTYSFTVHGAINGDPHKRSDTKALAIVVRDPLAIAADEMFDATTRIARTELGVNFEALFSATGGSGTNTWTISGGAAPPGLLLGTTGAVTGRPTTTGRYGFTVSVADTEGRAATYNAVVSVAARLAISTLTLRPGKVLKPFSQKIATTGGVDPEVRIKRGPIPKGLSFDRTLGVLSGTPVKAGTWRIVFEAEDSLGVKSAKTFVLRVLRAKPKPKPKAGG